MNKEPREPRGGLFLLVMEESLTEKVYRRTENQEMDWGKGDGHVYTSISIIIIIYFSMLDIAASLKVLSSTCAHTSVYRILRMSQSHPARHCLSTTAYPELQ